MTSRAPGCVFTTGEGGKKRLLQGILSKDGEIDGGKELSTGVASGAAQLARECRGVAVPCLWPITQTPGGAHPQGGQGSHSQGPGVRYYQLSHLQIKEFDPWLGGNWLHLGISHLQKIPVAELVFILCDIYVQQCHNYLLLHHHQVSLSVSPSDEIPNIFFVTLTTLMISILFCRQ